MDSFDVIISTEELETEQVMRRHRMMLDGGAKGQRPGCVFDHEEIVPYLVEVENPETKERSFLPETDETRQYRVLRRFYR
jgi:hypothetical protein